MPINWRVPRRIIPVIMAACPSLSYASDNNFCKPKAQEECLIEFANDLKSLKKCQGAFADLKRLCENKHSLAHRAPKQAQSEAIADAATPPPAPTPNPPLQRHDIFIRADRLDNPYPGLSATPSAGQALGASVSYTNNDFVQSTVKTKSGSFVTVSDSQSIMVTGLASYAILDPTGHSWDIAGDSSTLFVPSLSVSANGNWDHPTKTFGDTSALKAGPEFAFLFQPSQVLPEELFQTFQAYVGVSPFYQTDFYGHANAEGATLSFTPSYPNWFLFGPRPGFSTDTGGLFDGFLEVRAEATYLNVGQPGQTNLHQGSYEWLGGAARSYIFFFPSWGDLVLPPEIAPYIVDRLSFIGTVQYYWDANSKATAHIFSAALQYKIGACDTSGHMTVQSEGKSQKVPCTFGAPSITFQYDTGTDRDTLQQTKKFTTKLTYAF